MGLASENVIARNNTYRTTLPPWLWCWLLIYLCSLPSLMPYFFQLFTYLFTGTIVGVPGDVSAFSLRFLDLAELAPLIAVFLGVTAIVFPWLRVRYLTNRYEITEFTNTKSSYNEIDRFVHEYAPDIQLRKTGITTKELAFVYPLGYRKTALALGPLIISLWKENQQAAKAVLLHEIAHSRQGDTLIVGEGSFFEWVVRYWLYLYLVFTFLPEVLGFVAFPALLTSNTNLFGISIDSALFTSLKTNVSVYLPTLFFSFLSVFFQALSVFILPLLGMWSAEFNADHYVTQTLGSAQPLLDAFQLGLYRPSWYRWLSSYTHHPPGSLRVWMALRSNHTFAFLALLLLFPFAYIIKLLTLISKAVSIQLMMSSVPDNTAIPTILQDLPHNIEIYLTGVALWWLVLAGVLASWHWLTRFWERLFFRGGSVFDQSRYASSYGIAAVILVILSLLSYNLSSISHIFSDQTSIVPISSPTPASTSQSPGIGTAVNAGRLWSVVINSVQTHGNTKASQAQPGFVYIVVDITMKNISSQDQNCVLPFQMKFGDTQKGVYDQKYTEFATAPNGTVASGNTIHGQLVYAVPLSMHHFILAFRPDYTDATLVVWNITI